MSLVFSENLNECVPFRIDIDDFDSGPRLGGRPPDGIRPRDDTEAQYFATLSLSSDPAEELSLFFSMKGDLVAASSGKIHSSLIDVIVHSPRRRAISASGSSPLPEHALVLMPKRDDTFVDDEGIATIESHHKLGGRPFLLHNEVELERDITALADAGYRQVLQFDFPAGGEDAIVDGPWPFGDGIFHLFGRCSAGTWDWRWFWEL